MKALIIYKSYHHGNTRKVAETMADTLNAQLSTPDGVDIKSLDEFDIIGFGSGIYNGTFHKEILEFIEKLPNMNKKAFVFYTCGYDRGFFQGIKKTLSEKGFIVAGQFSCPGWDTFGLGKLFGGIKKGHPNEEDLKRAADFAKSLAQ